MFIYLTSNKNVLHYTLEKTVARSTKKTEDNKSTVKIISGKMKPMI